MRAAGSISTIPYPANIGRFPGTTVGDPPMIAQFPHIGYNIIIVTCLKSIGVGIQENEICLKEMKRSESDIIDPLTERINIML
jgi:hypothetical protein